MAVPAAFYNLGEILPNRREFDQTQVPMLPNLTVLAGTLLGEVSTTSQSEIQTVTVTGTPTGGTFRLSMNGQTTAAIAYNATGAQVAAAVAALPNVGAGNVAGTGGPLPGTAVVLTFQGKLANLPVANLVPVNVAFTGGSSPAVTVTETQTGIAKGRFGTYVSGNSDGTQNPKVLTRYSFVTDEQGRVFLGARITGREMSGGGNVFLSGYFKTGDIVNLDANAVTALRARFVRGDLTTTNGEVMIPGP